MATVFTRRIIAYVLDFFVVSAFMWIIAYLLSLIINPIDIGGTYGFFTILAPILGFAYFVLLEKVKGATIGKALMYLERGDFFFLVPIGLIHL